MARDDKASVKDEEYQFVPADFDEDAFIHREMVSFRTTTILFLWGIVAALVSWGLFVAVDGAKVGWLLGLVVCAAFGLALKFLFPRLKADIRHFGRKEWAGTAFLFFFTWLSFLLLAVNPPLSDFAAPRIDLFAPPVQQTGDAVTIDVFYEDNDRVAEHDLRIQGPAGDVPLVLQNLGRGHFRFVGVALPAGLYMVEATASDDRGHSSNASLPFSIVETAMTVFLPSENALDAPNDEVFVQIGANIPACTKKARDPPCVREVHLNLDGGGLVQLEFDAAKNGWGAGTGHAGWRSGAVTFNVTAQLMNAFSGQTPVPGGQLTAGPYTLNVTAPLGDYQPKVLKETGTPVHSVPGIGPVLVGIGLLVLVAVVRRRQT